MNAVALPLDVPHVHKLTVDEFLVLNDSGAFDGFSKSELIDGEIVCLNAQFSRHARIKSNLLLELGIALRSIGARYQAWAEVSVRLSDHSLPEPDIVVTSFRGNGVVPLSDVAMLVEVSDSTLPIDLGRKAQLYASACVPEYWVVDCAGRVVYGHTGPVDGHYAKQIKMDFGQPLTSLTIAGLTVPTDRLD